MKTTPLLLATALLGLAQAAPTQQARHVRHEKRETTNNPWVKRDFVSEDFILPMRIGMTQSNLDIGHDLLMAVSDPQHPGFRQRGHYSAEEIHDLFAPSEEAVENVRAWLEGAGISGVTQSHNKQWIQFDISTRQAEELLKTRMHIYEHERTGQMSIGCDEYHVHESVAPHVDFIKPGIHMLEIRDDQVNSLRKRTSPPRKIGGPIVHPFPKFMKLSSDPNDLQYCDDLVTPACYLAAMNISLANSAVAGNELGIFEETPEYVDSADLDAFFANVYPRVRPGTFPILNLIDGAVNVNSPNMSGTEALLDFEISYPVIYPQQAVLYETDDVYAVEDAKPYPVGLFNTFLDAIDGSYCTFSAFGETGDNKTTDPVYPNPGYEHPQQCGAFTPTNVISFSYELAEFQQGTSEAYQKRQCLEYMKLGMQGTTVVFSSGDAGVSSNWGCGLNPEGKATLFNPLFPSNCPYVLSVGATTFVGDAAKDESTAVTQFPSGGGFSNYWPRPSYQDAAVEAFFAGPNAPTYPYYTNFTQPGNGIYARNGRGIPDVSAVGQNVVNFGDGEPYLVDGTSASAPLVAAMLTRINEELIQAGLSTVGFVNPVFYQNPEAFHDITQGTNPGCNTKGFEAGPGWDPLTGLGTPNYRALVEVFLGL